VGPLPRHHQARRIRPELGLRGNTPRRGSPHSFSRVHYDLGLVRGQTREPRGVARGPMFATPLSGELCPFTGKGFTSCRHAFPFPSCSERPAWWQGSSPHCGRRRGTAARTCSTAAGGDSRRACSARTTSRTSCGRCCSWRSSSRPSNGPPGPPPRSSSSCSATSCRRWSPSGWRTCSPRTPCCTASTTGPVPPSRAPPPLWRSCAVPESSRRSSPRCSWPTSSTATGSRPPSTGPRSCSDSGWSR